MLGLKLNHVSKRGPREKNTQTATKTTLQQRIKDLNHVHNPWLVLQHKYGGTKLPFQVEYELIDIKKERMEIIFINN